MALLNNKIKFLSGPAENLKAVTADNVGTFFLTEDTHQLYIGLEIDQNPVLLNKDVIFLADENDSSTKYSDRLYFVQKKNALCYYSSTTGNFVQINPDTQVTDFQFVQQGDNYYLQLLQSGDEQTYKKDDNGNDIKGQIPDSAKIMGLYIPFDITNQKDSNVTVSKTLGTNGKLNVEIAVPDGDVYTLSATDLKTKTNGGTENSVNLHLAGSSDESKKSDIKLIAGDNITLEAVTAPTLSDNEKLTTTSVTVKATDTTNVGLYADNKAEEGNGFTFILTDTRNTDKAKGVSVDFDPTIKLDNSSIHFVDGAADITTAVENKITKRLQGIDVLRYRGVVSTLAALQLKMDETNADNWDKISIGDVYKYIGTDTLVKSITAITIKSDSGVTTLRKGDLLIAQAKNNTSEEEDGTLKKENIVWDIVPSGDDIDTQYQFNHTSDTTNKIYTTELFSPTTSNSDGGSFSLATDKKYLDIDVTDTAASHARTYTIKHLGSRTDETAKAVEMNDYTISNSNPRINNNHVVTITVEENKYDDVGHNIKTTKVPYTIYDTHNDIDETGTYLDVGAATKAAQITLNNKIKTYDLSQSLVSDLNLASETLKFTATAAKTTSGQGVTTTPSVTIDILWDQF